MAEAREPVSLENIIKIHRLRKAEIRERLDAFALVGRDGSDAEWFAEMVFCFFTAGCSAKMGLRSVEAVRPVLLKGSREQIADALSGVHRYPNARARYVVESREHLASEYGMRLREKLNSMDHVERRDWLVREKGIKGLGYKEASHFLRNVGYRSYAILDKHVLNCLAELGLITDPKPPNTRSRYLSTEDKIRTLAEQTGLDMDEIDLVLWSMKTGVILK